jgi:polysaccharide biosynthesis/export protein
VGPLVAIAGSVNTPAIYEMKQGSSLSDLIAIAGGLSTVADSNNVTVKRLGDHERSVLEFPLDAQSGALPLDDGDMVRVLSIVPRFSKAVTLRGNVVNPGRYPWKAGMKVRDLIPDAQALLTRTYWLSHARMTDGRSTEYPVGDDLLAQIQHRNPNGDNLTGDLHRASPEINWSYAIVQRVNPVDLSIKLLSFDLGKAILGGDSANNLELLSDDIITVFSQSDVSVPQSVRARYIRLEGEVVRAGVYKVEEGELLRDVLNRAGGVTPDAYIYGTQMTRESARLEQQQSIDELARTLELQIRQAAISSAANSSAEDVQSLAVRQASQEALIGQLRNTKASGRIVLTLKPTPNSLDAYPAIALEDNDRIVIPHLPSTVSVEGMVYNPGSFVFKSQGKAGDYLKMAGRGKPNADMRHAFVLHADGTVVASTTVNRCAKNSSSVSFFRSRPNHTGSPVSRLLTTVRNFCFFPR